MERNSYQHVPEKTDVFHAFFCLTASRKGICVQVARRHYEKAGENRSC